MSNSAQLLVHNIRAMQSPSIQAKRDGQRQDFRRGTQGASDTHTHAHVHTQHAAAAEQTQQPSRATGHRGCQGGQWRATVSTWELVKQHNPNKNQNKKGELLGWEGNLLSGTISPSQTLGNALRSLELCSPRQVMVTHMSHLGRASEATPPKSEDLHCFHWGKGN